MEQSQKTTERLVREYDQAGAIRAAKIVRTAEGYVLVIEVAWKEGELIVFNQRGKPRAWVSMDRLLRYLADVAPSLRYFDLVFDQAAGSEVLARQQDRNPGAKLKASKNARKGNDG